MKLPKEFQLVYKRGKASHAKSSVLFYLKGKEYKNGFTASKKVGNAVFRNRAKRRLRAIFQELSPKMITGTYIFVAKESIRNISYANLKNDMQGALKKVGALK
ncbi:ribonuclease P protein component [Sulfurimonas sp. MAG313]|nr:ribonuclease P protein component [Sulfurimonas sp. MAG313]